SIVWSEICGLSRNCVRASPPAKPRSANVTAETSSTIMSPCRHFLSSNLIMLACSQLHSHEFTPSDFGFPNLLPENSIMRPFTYLRLAVFLLLPLLFSCRQEPVANT